MGCSMTEEEARRLCMGAFLWRIRERAQLPQCRFAAEIGVSQATISRVEEGKGSFSEQEGLRWVQVCGFPVDRVRAVLDGAWDEAERVVSTLAPGESPWWERGAALAGRDGIRGAIVWSVERMLHAEATRGV